MVTRRSGGGHSCRQPGRHQDRAHQGRSLLGGHPHNLRVRSHGQSSLNLEHK